ncbi:MAG: extracellular solute-binding protein [Bacillota bacterium]
MSLTRPIKLRCGTTYFYPRNRLALFNKAKRIIEQRYPDVEVIIEVIGEPQKTVKWAQQYVLRDRMTGKNAPDIIEMRPQDFEDYLKTGLVLDLIPYLQKSEIIIKDFFTRLIELVMPMKGKLSGIPLLMGVWGIYYNRKLFDKAGIPYPKDGWTWDDFVNTAKELSWTNKIGVRRYALTCPFDLDVVEPYVISNGGQYLSPDGNTAIGYLNHDYTAEVIQEFANLYTRDQVAPLAGLSDYSLNRSIAFFMGHRTPMLLDTSMMLKCIPSITPNMYEEIGVVGLPRWKNGKRANQTLFLSSYGISSNCPYPELAWEFLKELTLPISETGKQWTRWDLPTTKKLADVSGQWEDERISVFLKEMDYLVKTSYYRNHKWYGQKIYGWGIGKIITREKITSQFLDEASQVITKYLNG